MDSPDNRERLEKIYHQLTLMANGNFSQRIERTDMNDDLEALAVLINNVSEKIKETFYDTEPRKNQSQGQLHGQLHEKALKYDIEKGHRNIHFSPDIEIILSTSEYIVHHLIEPLPLKDLAHTIGINEYKLKKGFKELFGMTVFQYIKDHRLRKAYVLVRHTNYSVLKIAKMVGFKKSNHLSREFKKRYGHTPTDLRNLAAGSETGNFNSIV